MTRGAKVLLLVLVGAAAAVGGAAVVLVQHGVSARDEPTAVEAWMARRMRQMATPRQQRMAQNPVPLTPELLIRARAHFADHCASCHGTDGRGKTAMGQNLSPKAPDMRLADTQSLSDGQLFATIKNGVRLTGMPAWGSDTAEDDKETWELVHFIRHLPKITEAELQEMKELNPKSRSEYQEEEQERRFLEGGGEAPASPSGHKH